MMAVTKILAGGAGLAALVSAAPAAAQYYPGYGYGNQNVLGQVLGQILGGNRAYGQNDRVLIDRCAAAVQQRIDQRYGAQYGNPYGYGSPYGGYGGQYGYGYGNAYGQGRVLGVTRVDRRSSVLRVRGTATANANAGYGYGSPYGGSPYGGHGYAQPAGELSFKCDIDYRGYIRDIDINRNTAYGYPY
ncbi:MAG TPA: hypothetical protein VFK58_06195 [Sphingomicrobium sp.]|nr:hypothetical protein [Sphingomicrobium sp.]